LTSYKLKTDIPLTSVFQLEAHTQHAFSQYMTVTRFSADPQCGLFRRPHTNEITSGLVA